MIFICLISLLSCSIVNVDDDEYTEGYNQTSTGTQTQAGIDDSANLAEGKARLRIQFKDSGARTVLPHLNLQNFVLTGKMAGGAETELLKSATKSGFSGKSIEILTGSWEFTMKADVAEGSTVAAGVTVFKDTISKNIGSGTHSLSFELKPFTESGMAVTSGEVKVTLTLSEEAKPDMAIATLKDSSEQVKDSKTYPESGSLVSGSTITYQNSAIEEGTYHLAIEFYSMNEQGGKVKQNTWEAIVRIVPGLKAVAEVTNFNLNEVYHITYENVDGANPVGGSVQIKTYSRKSDEITLSEYEKSGSYFMGWYEEPSFPSSSSTVTKLNPKTTTQDKTFYALWAKNEIYIKSEGSGMGYSEESAVPNFEKAIDAMKKVKEKAGEALSFTFKICGEVTGAQVLPSTLTTDTATKLTLTGKNGLGTDGKPLDALKGNDTITVLKMETAVPVEMKNITVSGGKCGIESSEDISTLTLESGSLITENKCGINFGGGTLVIKDGSSVSGNNKGGMNGAGIYVAGGTVDMKGGKISGNEASGSGGGVYLFGGTFSMTGGEISDNKADSNGGAIFNSGASISMSGTAYIPLGSNGLNDVYLAKNRTITVAGELTLPTGSDDIAATITANEWKRGVKVLSAPDGQEIADDITKNFAYTSSGWKAKVSNDKKTAFLDAPIYVAPNGADEENTPGTKQNPFKTIKRSVQELKTAVGGDLTIYVDGTLAEPQEIPADFAKSMADSLTIKGEDDASMINADKKGTALTIKTEVPVKIIKFTIKNGKADSTGGGIYIEENNADVTLGDGTVSGGVLITANEAQKGGGIYNKGKLTIKYGVSITSNTAKDGSHSQGGGIYNEGTFVMEDGTISSNRTEVTTNGYGGGGIANINSTASVYILGGAIKGNTTTQYGGGILNYQGKIFVSGNATIGGSGTDKNTADDRGGGIYTEGGYWYLGYDEVNSEKEWTGKIAGNTAVKGGGIYSSSAVITMNSGSIESNVADSIGGAVYEADASQLKMSGSAVIVPGSDQKNDVYLEHEKTITVSGSLENENLVALITIPEGDYTAGTQVLAGDAVSSECYKFRVRKPDSKPEMLLIGSDGKLVPIITFPNGSNYGTTINSGTEENPGDGLEYDVYKYSYLNYDNIKISVTNPYETCGFTMSVKIDGNDWTNGNISEQVLDDGFHTFYTKLEKSGAETAEMTKRLYVNIKKVKIALNNGSEIKDFKKDYFHGGVYINNQYVKDWDYADFSNTHFDPNGFSTTLDKKDADFICEVRDAYMGDSKKGKNSEPLRDAYRKYTLSEIIHTTSLSFNSQWYNKGGNAGKYLTLVLAYTITNDE